MKKFVLILVLLVMISSLPAMALTYEDMARYPDNYIGQTITITGKVSQVDYVDDGWAVRMFTKKSEYGYWIGDDLFVYFAGTPSSGRVLEDDVIQVTGSFAGPFKYTTVLGAQREIPLLMGISYVINPTYSRY